MDGSRISACFEALIKFHKTTSQFKTKAEEIAYLRGIVIRLLNVLKCEDKLNRNALLRQSNYAQSLVLTLQYSYDREVHQAMAQCMAELLGHASTGHKAHLFVKLGATQAICQAIALEWRQSTPSDSALLNLHLVLAKLAPKDKRLATKARLCQCVPVILSLLRQGLASQGAGQLLGLLRIYAASRQSSASLGRHGGVSLLLRLLSDRGVSRRQPRLLRRAAETLAQLTKVRANLTRAIAQGAPAMLLDLLSATADGSANATGAAVGGASASTSASADGQHDAAVLRALLLTLRYITAVKSGRAAFNESGGPAVLYALCAKQRSGKDDLLSAGAGIVLRQCAPRTCLPVPGLVSPHTPALLTLLLSCAAATPDAAADCGMPTTAGDDAEPEGPDDRDDRDSDCDSSGEARERKRQQRQLSDETATALVVDGGGRDPRSPEELRATYGHLEPELHPALHHAPPPPPHLTQSPSLPSFLCSQLHQATFQLPPATAAGRLSVSATSALLATSASSMLRRRSFSGLSEALAEQSAADSRLLNSDRVRSIVQFAVIATPELTGVCPPPHREVCYMRRSDCALELMLDDARRWIEPSDVLSRVVFDLDALVADSSQRPQQPASEVADDAGLLAQLACSGKRQPEHLLFESRFESGNLRRAIQIRDREYDLMLCPDVGHKGQTQWFYFRLANCEAGVPYRFNVINCEKPKSQFNCGMRPLVYSVREAQLGRPHWLRSGRRICYYRNHYLRRKWQTASPSSASSSAAVGGKSYYTASFSLTFRHTGDVCYIAYYVPYTYTRLLADLDVWRAAAAGDPSVFYAQQWLCESLGGNRLPVLTVTAAAAEPDRPCIFITGRVHPGEANASWVVRGFVNYVLSPAARFLRRQFVVKIVPMLNPDGVINGNHRCSLSVEDLNRAWIAPTPARQPEIYHTKGLLSHMCASGRRPVAYIDCHGHSRHNNVFLFGCCPSLSWLPNDRNNPGWLDDGAGGGSEDPGYKELPRLLAQMAPAFSWGDCNFKIDRTKETTARVVTWRYLRILRAYTLEASYSCCDQGPYKGFHVGTRELEEMGAKLGEALQRWGEGDAPSDDPLPATPPLAASAVSARRNRFVIPGSNQDDSRGSDGDNGSDECDDYDDDGDDDDKGDGNNFAVGESGAGDAPCRSSFVDVPDGELEDFS